MNILPFPSAIHATTMSWWGRDLFAVLAGIDSWVPSRSAAHRERRGQAGQSGRRGVHTVAPRSIRASAVSLPFPGRISPREISHRRRSAEGLERCPETEKSLAMTRFALASRMGASFRKAIAAMAPAVDRPMPGSAARSSGASGRRPPFSRAITWAARWRLRARE